MLTDWKSSWLRLMKVSSVDTFYRSTGVTTIDTCVLLAFLPDGRVADLVALVYPLVVAVDG